MQTATETTDAHILAPAPANCPGSSPTSKRRRLDFEAQGPGPLASAPLHSRKTANYAAASTGTHNARSSHGALPKASAHPQQDQAILAVTEAPAQPQSTKLNGTPAGTAPAAAPVTAPSAAPSAAAAAAPPPAKASHSGRPHAAQQFRGIVKKVRDAEAFKRQQERRQKKAAFLLDGSTTGPVVALAGQGSWGQAPRQYALKLAAGYTVHLPVPPNRSRPSTLPSVHCMAHAYIGLPKSAVDCLLLPWSCQQSIC